MTAWLKPPKPLPITNSAVAPKAHLASNTVNWGPYYKKTIKEVLDGSWKTGRTIWGAPEGANEVIKLNDAIPEALRKKVEEAQAALKAGTLVVFTGPVIDNTGKERLAKDAKPEQDWLDKVDFYVKGVDGKIPTGK